MSYIIVTPQLLAMCKDNVTLAKVVRNLSQSGSVVHKRDQDIAFHRDLLFSDRSLEDTGEYIRNSFALKEKASKEGIRVVSLTPLKWEKKSKQPRKRTAFDLPKQ
jgi:hypothetical protein